MLPSAQLIDVNIALKLQQFQTSHFVTHQNVISEQVPTAFDVTKGE